MDKLVTLARIIDLDAVCLGDTRALQREPCQPQGTQHGYSFPRATVRFHSFLLPFISVPEEQPGRCRDDDLFV